MGTGMNQIFRFTRSLKWRADRRRFLQHSWRKGSELYYTTGNYTTAGTTKPVTMRREQTKAVPCVFYSPRRVAVTVPTNVIAAYQTQK